MSQPPELLPFHGDWTAYEDRIYEAFLDSFVHAGVRFRDWRVSAQYRPETRGKGYSFWHTISQAADRNNRNEEDRIPDLRRCERILWIRWVIDNAGKEGFPWWENERWGNTHVVIWARQHDFAVVLAKRRDYYVLKTAYAEIKPHRRATFESEWSAFCGSQKG
jgi:hypothetical protein